MRIIGLLPALLPLASLAATLTGQVVGISDGDTITVLVAQQQVKVRLADIDAPESKQAFGTRSKQALSDLCFGKDARLETQGKDRYGRTIATVYCSGRDANAHQVREGMAWVFERYAKKDSPLYAEQRAAQLGRRGLWSDPEPVPPWEWRAHERDRKGGVPSALESPAVQAKPQLVPKKWVCDRKEVSGQAVSECGWR